MAENPRKRAWKDDRSTDKIYASGDVSALGPFHTIADSKLKFGERPTPIPTDLPRPEDRSADKYYRDRVAQPPTVQQLAQQAAKQAAKLGPPLTRRVESNAPSASLVLSKSEDVRPVLELALDEVRGGQTVVVYLPNGDSALLHRARTALELMSSRGEITEDQVRGVRFSYTPATPKPEQAAMTTKKAAVPVDPLAFLTGSDEMPEVDTTPQNVQEVDTSHDPAPTPGPEEDDNDFLKPRAVVVEPPTQPAKPAQPVQPAQPTQPAKPTQPTQPAQPAQPKQKPGKRQGRGS